MRSEEEQERLDGQLLDGINNNDAAATLHALKAGANPNSPERLPMHMAAGYGNPALLRLLIAYGGDAELEDPNGSSPLIYAAANGRAEACDMLLQTFPELRLESSTQNALNMTVKEQYHEEAMLRLLDAGALPHHPIPHDSQHITPYDTAGWRQNGEAIHLMNQYARSDLPAIHSLTHELVAAPGKPLLQHPEGWQNFDAVTRQLERLDTPLTKADLTAEFGEARSYMRRAVECYRLDAALEYLNERGERLTADDLLTEKGTPNALLTTCMERQALGKLFATENWVGQAASDLQKVWNAVPQSERGQVAGFEVLRHLVREHERAQTTTQMPGR